MNLLDGFRPTPRDDLAAQRSRRALEVAKSSLPEFSADELTSGRFGLVLHHGDQYRIVRGVVDEPKFSSAVAFFVNADGDAVYLERVP